MHFFHMLFHIAGRCKGQVTHGTEDPSLQVLGFNMILDVGSLSSLEATYGTTPHFFPIFQVGLDHHRSDLAYKKLEVGQH